MENINSTIESLMEEMLEKIVAGLGLGLVDADPVVNEGNSPTTPAAQPTSIVEVDENNPPEIITEVNENNPLAIITEVDKNNPPAIITEVDKNNPPAIITEVDKNNPPAIITEVDEYNPPAGITELDENNENLPPSTRISFREFLRRAATADNDDQTMPINKDEEELIKCAKRNAPLDRVVPIAKKNIKLSSVSVFRQKKENNIDSPETGSSIPFVSRRPQNMRIYELNYMDDPPILEDLADDNEPPATVPEISPKSLRLPVRPFLRLGLSRRARPRKPLHENVLNLE